MKKILFVVDERKLGGVSVLLESLLQNIDTKNLNITLLVLHNNGDRFTNLPKEIQVKYIGRELDVVDISVKDLLKSFRLLKALKKIVLSFRIKNGSIQKYILKVRKKYGITEFDTEIAFKAGFCSLFIAFSSAKCKINWIHEDYATFNNTKRYEKTFKKILPMIDTHVVVSSDAAKSFNNIYHLEDKTLVIENYINEKEILRLADEALEAKINDSKLNIVTLGRLSYEKGIDRLIDAVKLLKSDVDIADVAVSIIGNGKIKELLQNRIKEYGLYDIITIYDNIKNPYSFMKSHDIFIMPSRSESFGMVRIEALILNLPVITTNVSHTHEIINENNGIVVENSVEGIYEGLKQVIQNRKLILKLRDNIKNYSYEEKNKEIISLVQKLLEE